MQFSMRSLWTSIKANCSGLNVLLIFTPISIVLRILNVAPTAQFVTAALAIIPLAGILGHATEAISDVMGPGIGGLLNATFGNAAELIISLFSVFRGLDTLVKSSLVGSIISNLLLVLGASILLGGMRYRTQRFSINAANIDSNMAAVAAIGFLVPSMFHAFGSGGNITQETRLSTGISLIFLCAYLFMLFFQLKTHTDFFDGEEKKESFDNHTQTHDRNENKASEDTPLLSKSHASPTSAKNGRERIDVSSETESNMSDDLENQEFRPPFVHPLTQVGAERAHRTILGRTFSNFRRSMSKTSLTTHSRRESVSEEETKETWSVKTAMIMLVLSTLGVICLSEILTGAVEVAGKKLGIGEIFMGVIVIAIVGNAAEHFTAVTSAMHDKMDISISISFGSALQIAMFVVPVIILISHLRPAELGPMNLTLTEFEVFSVTVSVVISWMIVQDGLANWLEGIMLLIIYLILALAFFFAQDVSEPTVVGQH